MLKNNPQKLSQRDIAGILKIDTKTLYNWKKNKPELYEIVMLGFRFKALLEAQKNYTKELEQLYEEILQKPHSKRYLN
ncbi:transcriptional regulator [Helicobacter valdiviensis]|uniref:Transcriptional regulator n=1 Tax=Helicobacter valdiviensis TaxID=1458358 RepID=A0A2W6N027_9HELI|nr:transcriptional regulator [Helicobacter valdiviensis]PZT49038.1 transcriptional regulator [Helicobacter valdiviensis]